MNLVRRIQQFSILVSIISMGLAPSNPVSAQQKVCVITDEGVTVCGKLTTQNKMPANSAQRKEIDKFIVLLKGCRRSDSTIKCNLLITNREQERELRILMPYSTVVDSLGKSYSGSTVDIGGKSGGDLSTIISPGIDYVADISFDNIPQQITQIPLLNIFLNTPSSRKLQFRNVYLSN